MLAQQDIILDVTATDGVFENRYLQPLGYPVVVCHGPDHGKACPLLKTERSKIDGAHGVVFQLDLDRPQHRVTLKRYQEILADDVPLWAVVRPGQDVEYAAMLAGVRVVVGSLDAGNHDAAAPQIEPAA